MNYTLLDAKAAHLLRRNFITKFADNALPQYRAVMGHGDFYGNGNECFYLWEILRPRNIISFDRALSLLSSFDEVLVTWDNNAIRRNEKTIKDSLIKLCGSQLAETLKNDMSSDYSRHSFLPQDIYVFDPEIKLYLAFTHKNVPEIGRLCFSSCMLNDMGISESMSELLTTLDLDI